MSPDIIPKLSGSQYYSTFDFSNRYWAIDWLRGTVVERRSLTGELSLSCSRPEADR